MRLLRIGCLGDEVKQIQTLLGLIPHGVFGSVTDKAVRGFQLAHNLVNDGIVGPKTMAALNDSPMTDKPTVVNFAKAIQQFEGWYEGSRSYDNNNPGNLEYHHQDGTRGSDGRFAIFVDYPTGFKALCSLIERAKNGKIGAYKPTMTIIEFFEVYAPAMDSNHPVTYGNFVAKFLGVEANTFKIKNLI